MKQPELFAEEDHGPIWAVWRGQVGAALHVEAVETPEDMVRLRVALKSKGQSHVFLRAPYYQMAMDEGAKRLIQLERDESGGKQS
jgi:hypothetical protein